MLDGTDTVHAMLCSTKKVIREAQLPHNRQAVPGHELVARTDVYITTQSDGGRHKQTILTSANASATAYMFWV